MKKISEFGCYEGYSQREFPCVRRISVYVAMADGTKLAVDCYIPQTKQGQDGPPLPVILHYTPYARCAYTGETVDGVRQLTVTESIGLPPLTEYGYVLAIAQARGTGASFGVRQVVNSRQEARDGAELVQWLGEQPFSNGAVGTVGLSYHGQTQLEIISCQPSHLKAAFIGHTDFNRYDGWVRNGVPRAFGSAPDFSWGATQEEQAAQIEALAKEIPPVDEDPDGILLRVAIGEHIQNGLQVPLQQNLNFRDSSDPDYGGDVWRQLSASTYLDEINASGVPIYLTGGWFDVFRRDTFAMNANLTVPHKLSMGPWYHVGRKEDPQWFTEILRWFDYWLKGIENGIMEERPLTMRLSNYNFAAQKVTGEGTGYYRFADGWNPAMSPADVLYPVTGGYLSGGAGQEEDLTYQAAYGIKTSCEDQRTTRDDGMGVDDLGVVFMTRPTPKDYIMTGHPMAKLAFSMENVPEGAVGDDIDFFITLSDFDPDTGLTFQFSDGHLRSALRSTAEAPYEFLGLPWHPCLTQSRQPLTQGKRYTLEIDLMPVSYCLKEGHCLRMTISNALDRFYYLGRSAYEKGEASHGPEVTLYLGGEDGCNITLPDLYGDRM